MKKLIALMLAIVMVVAMMSVSIIALAADEDAAIVGGSLTTICENTEPVTVDVTYAGEAQIHQLRDPN